MKSRTIKSIVYSNTFDMGGMEVRQAFPSGKAVAPNPFLLLHHADVLVPTDIPLSKAGVGPHPHRGFSPVTIIYKGGVHHRDSRGNDNIIYAGGTQWMNAGLGIIHSERPPADIQETGGRQEIIQLWVNTPAAHKLDQPAYYPLTAEETPTITSADGLVTIKIHSGALDGVQGKIPTFSPVNTFSVYMEIHGQYRLPLPVDHNAFAYVLKGKIQIGDDVIEANYAALFGNDGDYIDLHSSDETVLLIGSGTPIEEPIASHGPFVMNSQTEIMQAFKDYQQGKMGILIED